MNPEQYSVQYYFSVYILFILRIPDDCNCMGFKYHSTSLITAHINIQVSGESFFNFGILDEPPCYVRQCSLVLKIVLDFFKCLGFWMHFISLYSALSLHNCSSSGLLVFTHLGRINYDHTSSNNSTDSYIIYRGIYSIYYLYKLQDLIMIHKCLLICKLL